MQASNGSGMEASASGERSVEHFDVVVIGAGQAGLAMGYCLRRQGLRFVILEAADSIGAAWRTRWDSLVLFTPRRYDALAGLPFPGDPDGYPTRDEVIDYLERYSATFELPVEVDSAVRSLGTADGRFIVRLEDRRLSADQVVVATGPFQLPNVPPLAGRLAPDLFQTHSSGYKRPSDVPAGTVLVVGGGNTGYQIAKELSGTRRVHLAVGSRQTPLPQRLLGRDLFWWLTKTGLIYKTVDSRIGRRAQHRDTLIGSRPRELRRYGIAMTPRVVSASERSISFADGRQLDVDAVIWATGYRSDYSWIDLPVRGPDGRVRHSRGVTDVSGLYFLGLSWQHTRGSALIGWVKDDAEFIATRIAAVAGNAAPKAGVVRGEDAGTTVQPSVSKERDMQGQRHDVTAADGHFPTDTEGLVPAVGSKVVDLDEGDQVDLRISPVAKRVADTTVRMLAYNGSIPGPTLRVREGCELVVNVVNDGDVDATVHWHGLRLDNRYDGTHETQSLIPMGGSFSYRIKFPDPGLYWYHPHVRQDYGQEMGLYGNILVLPAEPDYWPPAHRELLLTLDDVLIEDGSIAPFSRSETTHAAMGRFGNTLLIAGETDLSLTARRGEVVRFYLTNTANTRVFNVALPGARLKLVGGDSGRYEHETFVDSVVLSPSERAVVDVLLDQPGPLTLEHRTPQRTYRLATINVSAHTATPSLTQSFEVLRHNPEWAVGRDRLAQYLDAAPDKTLALVAEMDTGIPEGAVGYACPMHPDVVSDQPGRCPRCGMKLMAVSTASTYVCPMHPDVVSDQPGRCPRCGMKLLPAVDQTAEHHAHSGDAEHDHADDDGHGYGHHTGEAGHQEHGHDSDHTQTHPIPTEGNDQDSVGHDQHDHEPSHALGEGHHDPHHAHKPAGGIEWEDDMIDLNRSMTPVTMHWNVIDRETGAINHAINWQFRVGDQVKIRLVNEMDSDHPMHHPFHIHGAGRFVVLARDGGPEQNYVWKDTVLVRTGETVDILLDVTNPGRWMAHCHIAEHHESGMMFSFDVAPAGGERTADSHR